MLLIALAPAALAVALFASVLTLRPPTGGKRRDASVAQSA
jgi:hypothetical protein